MTKTNDCKTWTYKENRLMKYKTTNTDYMLDNVSNVTDIVNNAGIGKSLLDDNNNGVEPDVFFYHSDHLGSASWITERHGDAVQHLQYLPYGERYIDQHPFGYSERFTFTGKELDEETGYGYFGARYMDHELMTGWLSVDPMSDKYPSISPYAYCAWNPIKLVDPDGRDVYLLTNDGHIKRSQELTDKYQNKYGGNDVLYSQETGKFSRTFTVGTLSDMESHTTKGYPGSFLKLRDTERKDCVDVFIFCAENSNVEYSLMEFAQGESKETVLTTSHQIRTYSGSYGDDMGSAYAKDNICNLLSHIHNHFFTVGASYSEDGESPDMNFMNWVNSSRICANDESQGNSVSFGIYKCRGDKYMTDYYGNTIDPITMQKIKK